jgi:hypothetical protein
MPGWMNDLFLVIRNEETTLAVKIFLLKIVLNRSQYFEQYNQFWIWPLIEYTALE